MTLRSLALFALCMGAWAGSVVQAAVPQASLDHVAINVANAAATAQFYERAFGFAQLRNPFPGGGGVIWLDLGHGMAMHIFGGRKTPIANEHERHFAFGVNDIAQVTRYLKSRGMHWQDFDGVVDRMQTRPDGVHQLFFQDPDGYWIEVNDAPGILKH